MDASDLVVGNVVKVVRGAKVQKHSFPVRCYVVAATAAVFCGLHFLALELTKEAALFNDRSQDKGRKRLNTWRLLLFPCPV